ncbi:MAG: hypothetical protein M1493_03625 [Firmicutes bacterium]|nr:hypothetical protein [Bacillota bacterium]
MLRSQQPYRDRGSTYDDERGCTQIRQLVQHLQHGKAYAAWDSADVFGCPGLGDYPSHKSPENPGLSIPRTLNLMRFGHANP